MGHINQVRLGVQGNPICLFGVRKSMKMEFPDERKGFSFSVPDSSTDTSLNTSAVSPKRHFSLLTAVSCCSPGSYTELRQGPSGIADRQCVCCFFSPRAPDSYGPHFWGPWIPACTQEDCHLGDFTGTGFSLQSFTVALSSVAPRTTALDNPWFISIYKERKR